MADARDSSPVEAVATEGRVDVAEGSVDTTAIAKGEGVIYTGDIRDNQPKCAIVAARCHILS